jgi:HSP20 family molecular chaperone IbpA
MDTGLQSLPIDKSSIGPIVADKGGNRRFLMTVDMKGFTPEEIKVKNLSRKKNLRISAKREKQVNREFGISEDQKNYTALNFKIPKII